MANVFWGYQIGTLRRNGLNTTLWKKLYFWMKGVSSNLLQFSWYNYMLHVLMEVNEINIYNTVALLTGEIFKM